MEIRLLGPLEVLVDGKPVAGLGPRLRAILALLLIEPGRVAPEARFLNSLWDGEDKSATLRANITHLRQLLTAGPSASSGPVVERIDRGYRLLIPARDVDAHRFQTLCAEGHAAVSRQEFARACVLLSAALKLWRGDIPEDLALKARFAEFAGDLQAQRQAAYGALSKALQ